MAVTDKQLNKLAKRIVSAGQKIAKDHIAKEYYLENNRDYNTIFVVSDSGFEAIVVGDTRPDTYKGYMYLYASNTEVRNSFPKAPVIASLLRKVLNREFLEVGDGKASYFDWPEYGGLEKQLDYFSAVIQRLAQ